MSEATVAASFARALFEYAASRGASHTALAGRSGLALESLNDSECRIPLQQYMALMRAAKELSGDAALALHFAEATNLSELSIVGLIGPSSATIEESFALLNRYARLMADVETAAPARFHLANEDDGVWIVDTRVNPNEFFELTESTFVRLACNIARALSAFSGPVSSVAKVVHVTHPDPGYRTEYERILRAAVVFDSDRNAMLLNDMSLELRSPATSAYGFRVITERAEALLKKLDDSITTRGRVEHLLMPLLATGNVGMDAIAAKLGCTRWTLLRRLRAEGVTFEQVLDELRQKMALHYLYGEKLSIGETGYRVGFSDPAAFSRAFKRWTGKSPRAAQASRNEGH